MFILVLLLSLFSCVYAQEPSYELAKGIQDIYNPPRKEYVVLIDYSKSIYEDRLYVIDMNYKIIILKSKVSHAYKSGRQYATVFSNTVGSKKSSVGAFKTLNSYYGKWGYSMKITGLDPGINDNALKRAIVFHSDIVQRTTWSEGCFATPEYINRTLINLIKGGCLVYVYTN